MKVPPDIAAKCLELAGEAARRVKGVPAGLTPGEQAAAEVSRWCRENGWPEPVAEFRFAPPRRWRFDLAWPTLKLAVEFQGGVQSGGRHNRPAGFAADCEKFSTAAAMGWLVMPVTYSQYRNGALLTWIRRVMCDRVGGDGLQPVTT